jgi:hypothetical protein
MCLTRTRTRTRTEIASLFSFQNPLKIGKSRLLTKLSITLKARIGPGKPHTAFPEAPKPVKSSLLPKSPTIQEISFIFSGRFPSSGCASLSPRYRQTRYGCLETPTLPIDPEADPSIMASPSIYLSKCTFSTSLF